MDKQLQAHKQKHAEKVELNAILWAGVLGVEGAGPLPPTAAGVGPESLLNLVAERILRVCVLLVSHSLVIEATHRLTTFYSSSDLDFELCFFQWGPRTMKLRY